MFFKQSYLDLCLLPSYGEFPDSLCGVVFWHCNVRDLGAKEGKGGERNENAQGSTVNHVVH